MASDLQAYRKAILAQRQVQASGAVESSSPQLLSDERLMKEAEETADALAGISFDPDPPAGAEQLFRLFSRLVEEIDRRELPLSALVERCRFMFPPL